MGNFLELVNDLRTREERDRRCMLAVLQKSNREADAGIYSKIFECSEERPGQCHPLMGVGKEEEEDI